MKWLHWKTWNDQLSLFIILGIPGLWVFDATIGNLNEQVIGATILAWGLVVQFYYRQRPPDPPPPPGNP